MNIWRNPRPKAEGSYCQSMIRVIPRPKAKGEIKKVKKICDKTPSPKAKGETNGLNPIFIEPDAKIQGKD